MCQRNLSLVNGNQLLAEAEFMPNLDMGNGEYQLGWDSIVKFEDVGNAFKVLEWERKANHFETDNENIKALVAKPFKKISTKYVQSCTYFHIYNASQHIMGHLDRSALASIDFSASIFQLNNNGTITLFCSCIATNEEIDFINKLASAVKAYGDNDVRIIRGSDESNMEGLLEVGLKKVQEENLIFGEYVKLSRVDKSYTFVCAFENKNPGAVKQKIDTAISQSHSSCILL